MTTGLSTAIRSGATAADTEETTSSPAQLKIGIVTHYMPPHMGGIELVAETLFAAYAAAGCEVRWVASRAPANTQPREPGRIRVPCWNGLERRLGVPWPLWGPAGVREIAALVRWADVLHIHDCLYLGSALTVLFARRARKPVLLSQHVGYGQFPAAIVNAVQRAAYQTLGRLVLRNASHLVFCTPAAEEFVPTLLGGRSGPASTILNGIDIERFHPPTPAERARAQQNLGIPESKRIVLFVGRLVEKKGVGLFLEVARRLHSYHFLMVGDGPIRPTGINNLTWLPFVPPERMEIVYQAADVLLLPSYSEGFPLVVLEAMAAGLPVIVSKGAAFTVLLERDEACITAERTPSVLCEAVDKLFRTPGLAAAMAARARELVAREWNLKTMGARYLALVHELAGTRRSGSGTLPLGG
jgi:D-inositol-3-phosphate glycosyltransferase